MTDRIDRHDSADSTGEEIGAMSPEELDERKLLAERIMSLQQTFLGVEPDASVTPTSHPPKLPEE